MDGLYNLDSNPIESLGWYFTPETRDWMILGYTVGYKSVSYTPRFFKKKKKTWITFECPVPEGNQDPIWSSLSWNSKHLFVCFLCLITVHIKLTTLKTLFNQLLKAFFSPFFSFLSEVHAEHLFLHLSLEIHWSLFFFLCTVITSKLFLSFQPSSLVQIYSPLFFFLTFDFWLLIWSLVFPKPLIRI